MNIVNALQARAVDAKALRAEVAAQIDEVDAQISERQTEIERIRNSPIHVDDWVSQCAALAQKIAKQSFMTPWRTHFLDIQGKSNWSARGDQFNPIGLKGYPAPGYRHEAIEGAVLAFLGPELIEAGLRRLAETVKWPQDAMRQADKDARIDELQSQIDELSELRSQFVALLPI
jgi:hypothetical protein